MNNKKSAVGRPSAFNEEVANHICLELMNGKSLRRIVRERGHPDLPEERRTIYSWLVENGDFRHQYARAKVYQAESLADDIIDLVDEAAEKAERKESVDMDIVKAQVDARKWTAMKLRPRVCGEASLRKATVEREVEEEAIRSVALIEGGESNLPRDPKQIARVINWVLTRNQRQCKADNRED